MNPSKRRAWKIAAWIVGALVVLVGLPAFVLWYNLFREEPQHFDSVEEQFKYGSIGNEAAEGLPYLVWRVLPRVFPEHLPQKVGGGYAAFGVVWEEGHETPVGFSLTTVGFPRLGINCALCHTGTYRTDPHAAPTVVPTGPANRLDAQAYLRFLFDCAEDPRFTPDVLLEAIEYDVKLSALDKALYRYAIIPGTRKGLLEQKARYAWTYSRPLWGRGRIDPFNPVKFHQLGLDPGGDKSIGNSDMEPVWALAGREQSPLHWDGLNTSLTEVAYSGAVGDGATPKSLPVADLNRLEDYLKNARPPKYPYAIDDARAAKGKETYQQHCADCHEPGGKRFGQVIPLDEVKTDRHRLDMWTEGAVQKYNNYANEYPWRFRHFAKTDGYVAVPLDGLWLRAPYLHNGSVPTLEDLLNPAAERPKVFFRGYDLYDRDRTGFVHDGQEAERVGFRYEVSTEGNGNGGHEGKDYGTELSPEEKRNLVEYLKTK
jgi:hypothetical protein